MRIFALISLFTIVALTSCSVSILSNAPTPALFPDFDLACHQYAFPDSDNAIPHIRATDGECQNAACKERAVMVQDVTIPDDTYIAPGLQKPGAFKTQAPAPGTDTRLHLHLAIKWARRSLHRFQPPQPMRRWMFPCN